MSLWLFLELLGVAVFLAVILIPVDSQLLQIIMCFVTAGAISLFTQMISDMDDVSSLFKSQGCVRRRTGGGGGSSSSSGEKQRGF